MEGVLVVLYKNPEGKETIDVGFHNAEIHISTHGVLVIRDTNTGKVRVAYSAGTWHSANQVK